MYMYILWHNYHETVLKKVKTRLWCFCEDVVDTVQCLFKLQNSDCCFPCSNVLWDDHNVGLTLSSSPVACPNTGLIQYKSATYMVTTHNAHADKGEAAPSARF